MSLLLVLLRLVRSFIHVLCSYALLKSCEFWLAVAPHLAGDLYVDQFSLVLIGCLRPIFVKSSFCSALSLCRRTPHRNGQHIEDKGILPRSELRAKKSCKFRKPHGIPVIYRIQG